MSETTHGRKNGTSTWIAMLLAACWGGCANNGAVGDGGGGGDDAGTSDFAMGVDLAVVDLAVGCSDDKGCGSGLHCDPATHRCVPCVSDGNCGDGRVCNGGACVSGCSAVRGCGDAGVCEVDAGMCVNCLPSPDSCATGSYCRGDDHTCQKGCKGDADCAQNQGATFCLASTHQCAACGKDGDCPLGAICAAGSCVKGCTAMHGCPLPSNCCAGACVDLNSDVNHCGSCANGCGNGQACCASSCVDPMRDLMNCGGCGKLCAPVQNGSAACVLGGCGRGPCNLGYAHCTGNANACETNLQTDVNNCGGCMKVCPAVPNGVAGCSGGACGLASCNPGFGDCDAMAANGCETDLGKTVASCGACGNACPAVPNGSPGCAMGMCGIGGCNAGFAHCTGNAVACETNTQKDAGNCGGCGKACTVANGLAGCGGGQCTVAACNKGFADCDAMAGDGCEVNLGNDTKNCGACNKVCTVPNGSAGCVLGACTVGACSNGFADCDQMAANGCEVNKTNDVNNCGACGKVCPAVANGAPACVNGQCTIGSCNPGFGDCDKMAANGCEANLATDIKNCGACANACPGGCGVQVLADFKSQPANWNFNGNAHYDGAAGGSGVLTDAVMTKTGTIVFRDALVVDRFVLDFDFQIGGGGGADGMGFMIEQAGATAVGGGGGGLGIVGLGGYGVEFDTYDNGMACGDPGPNHVGVDDLTANGCSEPTPLKSQANVIALQGSGWHTAHVTFDTGTISLAIDGVAAISAFAIPGFVSGQLYWFGFGGATGGVTDRHEVRNVKLVFPTARCL